MGVEGLGVLGVRVVQPERVGRLDEADAIVALVTAGAPAPWLVPNAWRMTLEGDAFVRVADRSQSQPASMFAGPGVHAVATYAEPRPSERALDPMWPRSEKEG